MEIKLHRDSISYYSKVLSIEFSQEETAENIVPDTLPDISSVIDADAMAIMRGKDISDGRITVSGMLFGHILYRSDGDDELRKMPVQLPFSAHWDNSSITQASKCAARLSVSSFEGRIINSRKLLLRAEVVISADIFNSEACEFTKGVDCEQLEVFNENIHFSHLCAVGERTFSLSEELLLPAAKPHVESIVKYRAKLFCSEVKSVGSRLVVKGTASVYIVYKAVGGGELNCVDFSIPFSQIYDTDCSAEITAADAMLMLTGVYIEANDASSDSTSGFKAEIGAVAQFCAWSDSEISCVCDAYSTQNEISMTLSSSRLRESQQCPAREESVSQLISTTASAKSVIDVYTYIGKQRTDGDAVIWPVIARVIYESEEGKTASAFGSFEITCEYSEHAGAKVSAETGDIMAKVISGGIELRIPVKYTIVAEDELGFATPTEIIIDEEQTKNISAQPSIIVLKADGSTSLWSLAKQFNTTIGTINEANPGLSGRIPEKGELLLIAKKR
ncbi:MAG: DUF3794 domain-containing protein [Clostridiales bacterium]|nr:DUF3794 domain-containing protein [Clostridiales bacterium]